MKIVLGIARGLKYLHELDPPFTISELNSSAVYLTEDFYPKVCQCLSHYTSHKDNERFSCSAKMDILENVIENLK